MKKDNRERDWQENGLTSVVDSNFRSILFWATIGIQKSRGGHKAGEIEDTIKHYAKHMKMSLPKGGPKFGLLLEV